MSVLFDDQEPMARRNAHKAVEMVSEIPFGKILNKLKHCIIRSHLVCWQNNLKGSQGIVDLKLIKKLVDKLKTELDEIKVS